ncbi:MAG: hypothetical protein PHD74_08490, partial [Candidatus Krumholzibacteria bacterium]|nr:hypothetical protein [Candidatus Krumholzibacteria bacterium]
MKMHFSFRRIAAAALAVSMILVSESAFSASPFSPEDVLAFKSCYELAISPLGEWIACTVSVPRTASDAPGGAYGELWLISTATLVQHPFITGKVNVREPQFDASGSRLAFLMARGDDAKTQVWMIPVAGGEATQVTSSETDVSTFRWHPAGDRIAYVATTPRSKLEKDLDKKGYGFTFYEENLKDRNLYMLKIGKDGGVGEAQRITEGCSVWGFEFSPDGRTIAAGISPKI